MTKSKTRPEGPYESEDIAVKIGVAQQELLDFLELVEQLELEFEQAIGQKPSGRELHMQIALLRNHLTGRLTTTTSLIDMSGLTYGTASRAIEQQVESGLMVKRPRTKSGKSFSLHPTDGLINHWIELRRRTIALLSSYQSSFSESTGNSISSYFFGGSFQAQAIIAPPAVYGQKLNINSDLRLLVHADPTFLAMNNLKKQMSTVFGVGIRSRALSIDRLREEIKANGQSKQSRYDVVAVDLPWFGEMAKEGLLLPLDDFIHRDGYSTRDFHAEAIAASSYRGVQYGLPVQTAPELLVCRKDLLDEANIDAPRTLEQTLAAAKALHRPERDIAGIAWNAAKGTPLGHQLMFVMAACGQPILNLRRTERGYDSLFVDGEQYRPRFDTEAAHYAADYLRQLLAYSPRGILGMSWYERAKSYADGEVAMTYSTPLLSPLFEMNHPQHALRQNLYLPQPCALEGEPIAPIGGYALAIPANLSWERIEASWNAIKTLTSAQTLKLYIENGSRVCPRYSVMIDPEIKHRSNALSIVDELSRLDLVKMWPRPPVPEISDIINILGEEMFEMLSGMQSVQQSLQNCQNRVDQMMRSNGHY